MSYFYKFQINFLTYINQIYILCFDSYADINIVINCQLTITFAIT
jgi:hypothetical protein